MKKIFIGIWILIGHAAMAQVGFNKAEYFFDTDPGAGLGTAVTTPAGTSDTTNFIASVSTAALSTGFHFIGLRIQDNQGQWGLFETRGFYISNSTSDAADITAAEYFYDSDPGPGNGNPIAVTPGATVNFNVPLPAALPLGFHNLAIRVRDADGKWGLFESRGFYISSTNSDVGDITAAEYFFDTDPGAGNGTSIPVTPGAVVNFTAVIPVSLSPGFHFLAIRVKDTDGRWGLFETRAFYISTSTTDVSDINAAEYFFDTDPGVGNGTSIPVTPGAVVNFTAAIPVSLTPGFHFLAIRARDADGRWGLFETRSFFISTSTTDVADITAAEYFFDTDPGVGAGTPISITAGAVTNFTAVIPAPLAPGFHFLAIRVKDGDGKWGLFENRSFYISTSTANMPAITDAEYFFDTDPGVGNANALTVTTPGDDFTQSFTIPVPAGMSVGTHRLAIRVKDLTGTWGLFEYRDIEVTAGPVPVTGLVFNVKKEINTVKLNWYTLTETNTSHYEIERSKDARVYEKLGSTPAAGNSNVRTDYAFTDNNPGALNYYRIRQTDIDGRFVYSDVKTVRFGKDQYTVYPVISDGRFTITGMSDKEKIRIFNSNGQFVKMISTNSINAEVDISNMASGTYYLIIENKGELVFSQKIIKR